MGNKRLLLIGGGGHCKSVLDSILSANDYFEIGIVERHAGIKGEVSGIPIVGCDDDLPGLKRAGFTHAFITIGHITDSQLRIKLTRQIESLGYIIPNVIDLSAVVSRHATMGMGVFVSKKAVVNAATDIGDGAIINTAAIIEHDCVIGEFAHIAPGAVLCGGAVVGNHSLVGANSVIKQNIHIGNDVIIGMGSVVINDIASNTIAAGSPCAITKYLQGGGGG